MIRWKAVLKDGTVLKQYEYCKDIRKLNRLNVCRLILEVDGRDVKEIDVDGDLIYYHEVFGTLFPRYGETMRKIFFGTKTNLWCYESGGDTGCIPLVYPIE